MATMEEMIVGKTKRIHLVMINDENGFDAEAFKNEESLIKYYADKVSEDDADKIKADLHAARIKKETIIDINTSKFAMRVYSQYPLE